MIGNTQGTPHRDTDRGFGALVDGEGSANHPQVLRLAAGTAGAAALADAVHLLILLHGRYPGVIDKAAERMTHARARDWMAATVAGFTQERAFLNRLVVATGPIPSTPRQSQSQSAVIAQANALSVLAQSERRGTALGAALALALDWQAMRPVLQAAAHRFDLDVAPSRMPAAGEGAALAAVACEDASCARALDFGARQLLVQHRGLWDLLETREHARAAA